MHGREVHDETRMLGEPFADVFPMMGPDVITHEMNRSDLLVNLPVQHFEKGDKCLLSLPLIALSIDLARTGVKGRKEVERPGPLVLMLVAVRNVLRLRWQSRRMTRSRLEGSLLVHRQDQLIWAQGTGIEVDQLGYGGIEGGVPRLLGREPHMMAPGFELMCRQNPAYGAHRDGCHHTLRDKLVRQFGTIPLGEATPQQIRAFASEAHDVDRHLWGKNRPWPRGQARR